MFLCIKNQQLKHKNSLSFIHVHAILAQLLAARYAWIKLNNPYCAKTQKEKCGQKSQWI